MLPIYPDVICNDWIVSVFFSRLDRLGGNSIDVRSASMLAPRYYNYMLKFIKDIEKFVGHFMEDIARCSVGCGFVTLNNVLFPCYLSWCEEIAEGEDDKCKVVNLFLAKTLDTCMVSCSPVYPVSDDKQTLPIIFGRFIAHDIYSLFFNGKPAKIWDVAIELNRSFHKTVCIATLPNVEPVTTVVLTTADDDDIVNNSEHLNSVLFDAVPLVISSNCGILSVSKRRRLVKMLEESGQYEDTILGRIPRGGSLSGDFLRVEKGGRFTGIVS